MLDNPFPFVKHDRRAPVIVLKVGAIHELPLPESVWP